MNGEIVMSLSVSSTIPAARCSGSRHAARWMLAALLAWAMAGASPGHAAETFHTCTGFIESLPATINTQGTWCLRRDLSTAITSGTAVTIVANNVTLDCNGYKLGGLAAGPASAARGIHSVMRQNITVRNCSVRGFLFGIIIEGGAGHVVEDNRLDNILHMGIGGGGENSVFRRNAVFDTGGSSLAGSRSTYGIYGYADVIDNRVTAFREAGSGSIIQGIVQFAPDSRVRGNSVYLLTADADLYQVSGIRVLESAHRVLVSDNHVTALPNPGFGIWAEAEAENEAVCMDNVIGGYEVAFDGCRDAGSNIVH